VEASASSTPIISTNVSKPFPIKQLEKEDESMEAAPVVVEEPTLDKEDDEDMNVAPLDEEESIPKTTNSDTETTDSTPAPNPEEDAVESQDATKDSQIDDTFAKAVATNNRSARLFDEEDSSESETETETNNTESTNPTNPTDKPKKSKKKRSKTEKQIAKERVELQKQTSKMLRENQTCIALKKPETRQKVAGTWANFAKPPPRKGKTTSTSLPTDVHVKQTKKQRLRAMLRAQGVSTSTAPKLGRGMHRNIKPDEKVALLESGTLIKLGTTLSPVKPQAASPVKKKNSYGSARRAFDKEMKLRIAERQREKVQRHFEMMREDEEEGYQGVDEETELLQNNGGEEEDDDEEEVEAEEHDEMEQEEDQDQDPNESSVNNGEDIANDDGQAVGEFSNPATSDTDGDGKPIEQQESDTVADSGVADNEPTLELAAEPTVVGKDSTTDSVDGTTTINTTDSVMSGDMMTTTDGQTVDTNTNTTTTTTTDADLRQGADTGGQDHHARGGAL